MCKNKVWGKECTRARIDTRIEPRQQRIQDRTKDAASGPSKICTQVRNECTDIYTSNNDALCT